jgi:hypothetical protein
MNPSQAGMYAFIKWLFDHLFSSQIGVFAVPTFMIFMLLKFFLWSRRTATGETAQMIIQDVEAVRQGIRSPQSYNGRLRRQSPQQRRRR